MNLAWIANDGARRATLKKRRKNIMKKVSELSTLCGVEACAVVYGPEDAWPEVWPSESEAEATLLRYGAMPESEQCKKRVDQAGFLSQSISKLQDQIRKQHADNRELELRVLLHDAVECRRSLMEVRKLDDAVALDRMIAEKEKEVKDRVEAMKMMAAALNPAPSPNPNPNPSGSPELDFWNGDDHQGLGFGLEEVMQGSSSSAWVDLSIFKDCHY